MKKNSGILIFFLSILIFGSFVLTPIRGEDAALLPNAVQQFFDSSGNPLSSGKVYFYEVGTSTFKDTYTSSAATIINTNPITLNAGGKASTGGIYGIGLYRQLVKDKNGNTIWDAVTAPGGGSGPDPSLVGDGNLVGTTLPWSGLVAPNQYVFAYGQEIARSSYPEFYTAITQQLNVICSMSSNILTGVSDTTQIKIGSPVELPLCVIAGTSVVSKTASTVTLSNPSSVSINSVATFYPYGNGNGSTTFNIPDLRGYAVAGRDNMGGSAAGRLTSTYFNSPGLGAVGGSQSHTQTISEMALHTHTAVISGSTVGTLTFAKTNNVLAGGSTNTAISYDSGGLASPQTAAPTGTHTHDITIASSGSSTAFSIVQPTITLNYVIKITPDTSTSIATGVYSIGGMTGIISCGTGILCTGNIISFNSGALAGGLVTNVQYKNIAGGFEGSPNFSFISPDNLTLGAAGVTGKFDIFGSTSGRVRQTASAVAGTTNITWGNASGTPAITASVPLALSTTTGNLTITGAAGQILAGATPAFTSTPVLGASGTLGSLGFGNATSGVATLQPVAGALGTITVSIPSAAGTMAVSASSPLALNATTGALTCTGCLNSTPAALTKVDDTNVTLTLGGTPTTALLQATSITAGWTGQLGLTRGGTAASLTASNGGILYSNASTLAILSGTATASLPLLSASSTTPTWATVSYPTSATSGGIPYFSSTSVMASSSLLTANQIMIGGGAGTAPSTFACATSTTIVHGGTPPTCSQIVANDVTTNTITNSNLSQVGAATIKGNPTASIANIQDFTIQGLTNLASPSSTLDYLIIYDHAAGTLKSVTPAAIAGSIVAGVSSLNTLTGVLTITGSNGIVTNSSGTTITITPDTATAANFEAGTANKLLDAAVVFTSETTTTYGTTTAFNFNTFINSKVTLTGNTTLTCSNIKAGQAGQIRLIQDGTGTRVITPNSISGWCSQFRFGGVTVPTLTTSASAVDILNYSCSSSTYCQAGLAKGFNP